MYTYLKLFILTPLFCIHAFSTQAQSSTFTIKATVNDEEGVPIAFGNVLALSPTDSSLLQGTIFMDGAVLFEQVKQNNFLLKITSLGYLDVFIPIDRKAEETLDLGTLKMPSNAKLMDEFEVVATKPVFEREGDKIIVNVSESDMSSAGTAEDVLRRSPNVITDAQGSVSIFGKGEAVIYLDGQRVNSNEVLSSLSSADIEKIEVIKNPSAKFDAEGKGGVINIITKQNNLEGYNVVLHNSATLGKRFYYMPDVQVTVKKKKLSLDLSLMGFLGGAETNSIYERKFGSDSLVTNMDNTVTSVDQTRYNVSSRMGLNYQINDKNRLGFQFNNVVSDNEASQVNTSKLHTEQTVLADIKTNTLTNIDYLNNAINLNYNYSDTNGLNWFTAGQLSTFDTKSNADIDELIENFGVTDANIKRSTGDTKVNIAVMQTDFSKRWAKPKLTLEFGGKNTAITNDSKVDFSLQSGDDWIETPSLSSAYDFTENITAGYAQFIKGFGKLSVRGGVRAEQTTNKGFSKAFENPIVDTSYLGFFPSAYIGYEFDENWTLGLTYSNRITRPDFRELEPYVQYVDSLSSFIGNPYLTPEFSESFEASLSYSYASIDFGYTNTRDAMFTIVDRADDGSNSFTAQTQNIENAEIYTASITIPYEIKWWTFHNAVGWAHNTFNYMKDDKLTTFSKPNWYLYTYHEFRFPKDFSFEFTGMYYSGGIDGIFEYQDNYNIVLTLNKYMLDDNLLIRLMCNDPFDDWRESATSNLDGFSVKYTNAYNYASARLVVRYSFGKLKAKDYEDQSVGSDADERAKKN